jgi:hypothetical protein
LKKQFMSTRGLPSSMEGAWAPLGVSCSTFI